MKKQVSTDQAPAAIGPYSQAIQANNMVFISGQLPINPASGLIEATDIEGQTEQVFKNLNAILAAAGLRMDNVVKTTVLLADMTLFAGMNAVYATHFNENFPARAAFAVKELPKQALVEIEAIAVA
jgi:2-iminobutanoate/2-iminopropanoate deaminase